MDSLKEADILNQSPGYSPGAGNGDAVSPGRNQYRFVDVNKMIPWVPPPLSPGIARPLLRAFLE
jgi:hypothetical protein